MTSRPTTSPPDRSHPWAGQPTAPGSWSATAGQLRCPSCAASLPSGLPGCPRCGIALVGPAAAELWRTDQQLIVLQRRRRELIDVLHQHSRVDPASSPPPLSPAPSVPAHGARQSWTGQQVLLATGALLVVTAAVVFLAVAWSALGVGGQVAVMAALTVAAGAASLRLARGRLTATAETLGAVSIGLAAVDLAAAHSLDLAGLGSVDESWYLTGAAALLAVACAGASRMGRSLTCFPLASAVTAAAVPLLAVVAGEPPDVATALAFTATAAATRLAAGRLSGPAVRIVLLVAAACYLLAGWVVALVTVLDEPLVGAGGQAALVSLAASAGAWWWSSVGRRQRSGQELVGGSEVLLAAAVLTAVATIDAAVWSADPTAVATAALAAVAAAATVVLPVLAPSASSNPAVRPGVVGLHLLAGTALVLSGSRYLDGLDPQRSPLGWCLTAALLVTAVAAGRVARGAGPYRWPAAGYAALLVLLTGVVAAAPSGAVWTAGVLAALALVAAGLAARRHTQPAESFYGGTWLLAVVAALAAAASAGEPAVPTAAVLAAAGLTAAAYALLPRRGHLAVLASLLCSAAVWTLLAEAEVHTVEAYSLPLAGLLGVVGLIRLHREPAAPSWLTVGPVFTVGLLPSALASVSDPDLLRPLLVLGAGAAVLLLGVVRRWQAPLVVGTLALVVVAVSQLAPWAVGLPRWLSFGTVGLLLLVLGARYEQRRRNARHAVVWVAGLR